MRRLSADERNSPETWGCRADWPHAKCSPGCGRCCGSEGTGLGWGSTVRRCGRLAVRSSGRLIGFTEVQRLRRSVRRRDGVARGDVVALTASTGAKGLLLAPDGRLVREVNRSYYPVNPLETDRLRAPAASRPDQVDGWSALSWDLPGSIWTARSSDVRDGLVDSVVLLSPRWCSSSGPYVGGVGSPGRVCWTAWCSAVMKVVVAGGSGGSP